MPLSKKGAPYAGKKLTRFILGEKSPQHSSTLRSGFERYRLITTVTISTRSGGRIIEPMSGRQTKVLMIVAAIAPVVLGLWFFTNLVFQK